MAANISSQQIRDINSAPAYSIACDGLSNIQAIEQIMLLCSYVNSGGLQKKMLNLIPLKGQQRDICETVVNCLDTKETNTSHMVTVPTDIYMRYMRYMHCVQKYYNSCIKYIALLRHFFSCFVGGAKIALLMLKVADPCSRHTVFLP